MWVPDTTSIFQDRSCQDVKAFFFDVLWTAVQIALDESQGVAGFVAQIGILCIPIKFAIYVYTKVFCGGDNTQVGVVDVILYLDWGMFICDSQHLTFVRVEFHFLLSSVPEGY